MPSVIGVGKTDDSQLLDTAPDKETVEWGEELLQKPGTIFLFIKAKPEVSRCNLVSMFIVYLTLNLLVHTKLTSLSYLLVTDYEF